MTAKAENYGEPWDHVEMEETPLDTICPIYKHAICYDNAHMFEDEDCPEDICHMVAYNKRTKEEAAALARRIVACVNACAGIPTEELEQRVK